MTTNALIATPIVFESASYILRVTVDGNTQNLTFNATAGRYYWQGRDTQADADGGVGGVGDLLINLKTCLETHPAVWTVAVTLDANFRIAIVISGGATTFSILWTNVATTLSKEVFGFTADTASANNATGTNMPQGIWRANRPVNEDGREQVPKIGGVSETMTGDVAISDFGAAKKDREIIFDRLNKNVTLTEYVEATSPYGSLEYAWLNSIALGRPLRLYLDETAIGTSSAYTLYRTKSLARPWSRAPFKIRWAATLIVKKVT